MATETLYWGLRFGEWVTLAGLVLGPVVAVLITLAIEARRRKREQRVQVMRMLLTTRHLPADATYSVAINLIPVEFNDDRHVMEAWQKYSEVVRFRPSEEGAAEHTRELGVRQTKLIFAMMQSLGFKLAETDIQSSAYAADAFVQRDNIMVGSWAAMIDVAQSLRNQTDLLMGQPQVGPPSDKSVQAEVKPEGA